jgi:hypothetical protein
MLASRGVAGPGWRPGCPASWHRALPLWASRPQRRNDPGCPSRRGQNSRRNRPQRRRRRRAPPPTAWPGAETTGPQRVLAGTGSDQPPAVGKHHLAYPGDQPVNMDSSPSFSHYRGQPPITGGTAGSPVPQKSSSSPSQASLARSGSSPRAAGAAGHHQAQAGIGSPAVGTRGPRRAGRPGPGAFILGGWSSTGGPRPPRPGQGLRRQRPSWGTCHGTRPHHRRPCRR